MSFLPEDRELSAQQPAPDADYRMITPGYLHTLGIRLIRGRDFSPLDRAGAQGAVLISEATAQRYWPNEAALGQRLRARDLEKGPVYTVVGVVADVRYQSLETPEIRPMLYFSALAEPQRTMTVVVRGASIADLAKTLRPALTSLDPTLPAPTVYDLDELLATALAIPRFALVLFAVFAGAALLLAAIGIYGVMSYLVRQRTHELGIRVALGATPFVLIASVVGRALRWTLLGVAVGLAGAWGLTSLISALLFGVSATDPLTFVGVPLLLSAVAILASLIPARRAARADPMLALRGEG
jgi:predicted permease